MKILITGGCGFLGSNLVADALANSHEVMVFDNLSRVGATENLQWLRTLGSFEFFHGDIRNADDIESSIKKFFPDFIYHLAGQVAMTTSIQRPRNDFDINASGTLNLLEAVRKYKNDAAVIYSSTNKVYGDLEQYSYSQTETRYVCNEFPNGFDETIPLDFHSPYGCSKGSADQYVLDYSRMFGIRGVVFRHSSMYGGRQYATYDQGWIGWFCEQALAQKSVPGTDAFTISGNGMQVRDVLHADDMKSLYRCTIDSIDNVAGQAFNIGGGITNSLSLLELFSLLEELLNISLNYIQIPPRSSDQRVFVADTAKASHLLGWEPNVGTRTGITKMLEWSKTK